MTINFPAPRWRAQRAVAGGGRGVDSGVDQSRLAPDDGDFAEPAPIGSAQSQSLRTAPGNGSIDEIAGQAVPYSVGDSASDGTVEAVEVETVEVETVDVDTTDDVATLTDREPIDQENIDQRVTGETVTSETVTGETVTGETVDGDTIAVEVVTVETMVEDDRYGAEDADEPESVDTSPAIATGPPPIPAGNDPDVDDGGQRRRRALVIVAVALLTGALGMLIGSRIQSPADRAASRSAPEPSLITVPVERRTLASELILNGEVAYNAPVTIQLAGSVGIDTDEKAILTAVPTVGADVPEGKAVFEVTDRPVIALQGALPMYRTITIGTVGPDVAQLEAALKRLGFDPGPVDETADTATMAAVTQMYSGAGFAAPAATKAESAALAAAKQAVADAQANVSTSKSDSASSALSESSRMELDRAVTEASNAIPAARAAVGAVKQEQDGLVAAAIAERDSANQAVADLQALFDAANSGATNPESGQRYSAVEIGELARQLGEARSTAAAAAAAVGSADAARSAAVAEANKAVSDAEYQLKLAQVQRSEQTKQADTGGAASAVTSAESALAQAQEELTRAQAAAGVRVPAGEVIFVPVLPANLAEWYPSLGSEATGQMGSIASALTQVTARISRTDTAKVPVGSKVSIEVREADVNTTGIVKSVGEPAATQSPNDEFGGPSNNNDGRLEVVVEPDDPAAVADYVSYSAKVVVETETTGSEQLVVPVAALSVGPDGDDRVEVERTPATADRAAETEIVPVTIGLTANGLAAVTPKSGSLKEGDRVVIGFDYPDRRVATGDASTDGSAPSGTAADSGDGGSSGDSGSGSDGGSGEGASPLAEFFGYTGDPVAEREQMLAVEESVAKCMKAEGFEYTPVDYAASTEAADYMDPDFGKKYGYGVIYNYETYETEEAMVAPTDDPNDEYVQGLSQSEMQDYYSALYGADSMSESSDEESSTMPPLEEMGCYGKAQAEIGGESPVDNEEVWTRVDELTTQALEDPEYKKLVAAWQDCMAEPLSAAGIAEPPESPDGYSGSGVMTAVERLVAEARGGKVVEFSSEEELNSLDNVSTASYTDETSGYAITGELKPLSADELERLRKVELELWNADQACQSEVGLSEYQTQQETKIVEQLKSEFPETDK